jgi:phosphopantetheinyl transferase
MKLVILNVKTIAAAQYESAFARMSAQRQEKCRRLASKQARLLCVAADMAARELVGDWDKNEKGKPICKNGYLSLAHSGDYAVAAWSDRPIGIDLEQQRPLSPALSKRLEGGLDEWVKKEAYGKAIGTGIYRVLDAPIPDGWKFSFPDAPNGYIIAICEKQEP